MQLNKDIEVTGVIGGTAEKKFLGWVAWEVWTVRLREVECGHESCRDTIAKTYRLAWGFTALGAVKRARKRGKILREAYQKSWRDLQASEALGG